MSEKPGAGPVKPVIPRIPPKPVAKPQPKQGELHAPEEGVAVGESYEEIAAKAEEAKAKATAAAETARQAAANAALQASEAKNKVQGLIRKVQDGGSTLSKLNRNEVGEFFAGYKLQIAQALPKHLSAERMIQMATTMISKNPDLRACSASSIVGAIMQASILGFPPVEQLGYCYILPYNNRKRMPDGQWIQVKEAQFLIGYKGLIDLARRSKQVQTIYAYPVYKGDRFEYSLGLNPTLDHKPTDKEVADEFEAMTHVYAVVHYKDGGYNFVVLTKRQVEKLRMRNASQKAGRSGAWATDYAAMACAKALRQLSKFMPLTNDIQAAVSTDESIIRAENFSQDQTGELLEFESTSTEDAAGFTQYTEVPTTANPADKSEEE